MQENLKKFITDEIIASRNAFNRVNYIIDEFKGFIYDQNGDFSELHNGEEVYNFIKEQNRRLEEIDSRPRDYSELYN